jgi:ankyrin repeat protein
MVLSLARHYSHSWRLACHFSLLAVDAGCTPLHVAAYFGRLNVLELLLATQPSADPLAVSRHGATPLILAAIQGYGHIVARSEAAGVGRKQ